MAPGLAIVQIFDASKHWWALRAIERGFKVLYLDSGAPAAAAIADASAATAPAVVVASSNLHVVPLVQLIRASTHACAPLDVATAPVPLVAWYVPCPPLQTTRYWATRCRTLTQLGTCRAWQTTAAGSNIPPVGGAGSNGSKSSGA